MRLAPVRRSALFLLIPLVLLVGATGCGDDGDTEGASSGGPTTADDAGASSTTITPDPYSQSSDSEAGTAPVSDHGVVMVETAFTPASFTVVAGTEVTWTNEDGFSHTTTSDDGAWDSGNLGDGATFTHTFDEPGTFTYVCEIHSGMEGEIVVE